MIEINTKLRKWGNSFGLVVPASSLRGTSLREGGEVTAFIIEKKKVNLKRLFGVHRFKKSAEVMTREIDEELYDD